MITRTKQHETVNILVCWIVYFTSLLTTISRNYTSCCNSRPPLHKLKYINSFMGNLNAAGYYTFSMSVARFPHVYKFYLTVILHFVKEKTHFSNFCYAFECVWGSKKIQTVTRFGGFSNRIVIIRSVNRKFGYTSHP